jgi:hypothetical protein
MPKKSKSDKKTAEKGGSTKPIVVRSAAAKPIIVRTGGGGTVRHHRRHHSVGGIAQRAGHALLSSERIGALIGGFALGVLDSKGTKLPTVPVLGRAGTCGVALYYLGKHMKAPMVSHAATGFLAIAAYEMGKSGAISGVDGDSVIGGDATV